MSDLLEFWKTALGRRFTIDRELDPSGTMPELKAREVGNDRFVVIHVLSPGSVAEVDVAPFLAGIERVAALRHAHVVPIEELGHCAGAPYFVAPFVEGVTLRTWLEREHQLPFLELVRV